MSKTIYGVDVLTKEDYNNYSILLSFLKNDPLRICHCLVNNKL